MQHMALPVVLTAEGTIHFDTCVHLSMFCIVTTSSSLDCVSTHFWLSIVLNGKQSIALALTYCASGSFGPFALPCVTKRPSYLLTLQLRGPQDLCLLGGRRVPYVYKKDRFQQNLQVISRIRGRIRFLHITFRSARLLQVISRKGESKSLPYARTNGEPYGLLSAMF